MAQIVAPDAKSTRAHRIVDGGVSRSTSHPAQPRCTAKPSRFATVEL